MTRGSAGRPAMVPIERRGTTVKPQSGVCWSTASPPLPAMSRVPAGRTRRPASGPGRRGPASAGRGGVSPAGPAKNSGCRRHRGCALVGQKRWCRGSEKGRRGVRGMASRLALKRVAPAPARFRSISSGIMPGSGNDSRHPICRPGPCCAAGTGMLANPRFWGGFSRAPARSSEIGIPSWIPIAWNAALATPSGLRMVWSNDADGSRIIHRFRNGRALRKCPV